MQSDQVMVTPQQYRESNNGRILDPTGAIDATESSKHHSLGCSSTYNPDSTAIDIFYD